jgi:hypothetical protein
MEATGRNRRTERTCCNTDQKFRFVQVSRESRWAHCVLVRKPTMTFQDLVRTIVHVDLKALRDEKEDSAWPSLMSGDPSAASPKT